jgi:hypothetical protein
MQQMNVKPAFEVEVLDGTKDKLITKMVDNEIVQETVQVPKGYMVYFPGGHSIGVETHAKLKKLGFDKAPNLVNMEDGEVVSQPSQRSLKSDVERKTKPTRAKAKGVNDDE